MTKTAWTVLATGTVPQAWENKCHIMDMAVGPDYNGDGSYDLYVAVANDANDAQGGYNNGYNFWTVLGSELVYTDPCNPAAGQSLELTQLSDPFTVVPEAGKIYGIAVDMYEAIPVTCAHLIAAGNGLSKDLNADCRVDLHDWALMPPDSPLTEVALIASQWLMCLDTDDAATGCVEPQE